MGVKPKTAFGHGEIYVDYSRFWDWLMPVVDKIESLGYEFSIAESRCEIKRNSDNKQVLNVDDWYIKKEATYNAVVEFIKTYNDDTI